jgi:hypothetical protein
MRLFSIIGLVILIAGTAVAQERVAVFEFEGIGIDQEQAIIATQLFRSELGATGKFTVIPKGDVEAKLAEKGITDFSCYAFGCASEYGSLAGADLAVIGTVMMYGQRVMVEVNLVGTANKQLEFNDRFSAISIDDIDSVLRKLAQAAAERRKIESEVGRFAITEEETMEGRRKTSYITTGAAFGFGFPLGDSYGDIGALKHLVFIVRYEAGSFVIDNSFGASWASGSRRVPDEFNRARMVDADLKVVVFPWDIGARYIFNRKSDFTPFIGGGMGLHFITQDDHQGGLLDTRSTSDFAIHIAGGIYAFQSYDFRLAVEVKYTALFTDAFPGDNRISQQVGMLISLTRKVGESGNRGCCFGGIF